MGTRDKSRLLTLYSSRSADILVINLRMCYNIKNVEGSSVT